MKTCSVTGCESPSRAKGLCMRHYKFLRNNGSPTAILRPNYGSGFIRHGYRYISVNGKEKAEHIAVAESVIGKALPEGAVVHHVDGNKTNNAPSNLVICPSRDYHNLIHTRINALKECGNPSWRKCVFCKKYDDPSNLKFPTPPSQPHCSPRHDKCSRAYQRARTLISTKE